MTVCTGNICRSPVGEYLIRQHAQEAGVPVTVTSSGISNEEEGNRIDPRAAAQLTTRGIDPSAHRASVFTVEDFDRNDLILAIATPACQAVAGATADIPIVGTAITDYAASGLVADNDAPGGNVTGTSDLTPVEEQFDLLRKLLPNAKRVAVLYCTAESNSSVQAGMAHDAASARNLDAEDYTVSSSNEIQQVVESMIGKVDVIYAPTDNTIAAGMQTVAMVATENKLPIICGESGMVGNGGLATYGIDYGKLGRKAGEMAVRILNGEAKPAEMPIEHLDVSECTLTTNEEAAKTLGIDLSVLDA